MRNTKSFIEGNCKNKTFHKYLLYLFSEMYLKSLRNLKIICDLIFKYLTAIDISKKTC